MSINMAYSLLQLHFFIYIFVYFFFILLYIGDRFGSIDHNRASRVLQFTEKIRPKILFYAFVHTAIGLELMGHLGMLRYFLCIL